MVTVKLGTKTEEKPFPKLMKDGEWIVLFSEAKHGMVIKSPYHLGDIYSDDWLMKDFTDYNEPVTLQNA